MTKAKKHAGGRPRVDNPKVTVSLRFDTNQLEKLDAMAENEGTSRTALIQLAVSQLLKKGITLPKATDTRKSA